MDEQILNAVDKLLKTLGCEEFKSKFINNIENNSIHVKKATKTRTIFKGNRIGALFGLITVSGVFIVEADRHREESFWNYLRHNHASRFDLFEVFLENDGIVAYD